ncbi:MAG: hypothetical protein ACK438_06815, partial [Flavobacteriales bacterium]
MMRIAIVLFSFFYASFMNAQSVRIYLSDSLTKDPIVNATVFIVETDQWFSIHQQKHLELPAITLKKITLKCYA